MATHQTSSAQKNSTKKDIIIGKRLFAYFRPHLGIILLGILASFFVAGTTAGTAWLIKPALDDIFIKKDAEMLLLIPAAFFVLILLKGAGRYFQNIAMSYAGLKVLELLRHQVFSRVMTLHLSFYESMQIGNLMSRIMNDVATMQRSLSAFVQVIRQTMTMIALLGVVFYQDFELALYAFVVLPIAASPFIYFSKRLRHFGRRNAEISATITTMLQELLSGVRVIKAFSTEQKEIARFDAENANITHVNFRQSCVSSLSSPVMELIGALGIGLVIWFGGSQVIDGSMTPGAFFSFVASLIMLYEPLKLITRANLHIQNAFAGAERVFAILDDPINLPESGGNECFDGAFTSLEFRHVNLAYGQATIVRDFSNSLKDDGALENLDPSKNSPPLALKDISLTIEAGTRVALVGPSGAGKTSLANLIMRFYEIQSGEILLNGIPLQDYDLASLRHAVAIVSQEGFLFNVSLHDNIAYGRVDIEKGTVQAAAVAAYADTFIKALPEGYDTVVGERGVKLSGGQKQRITIARALMKNAPLLILDEATSALDSESEHMVQQALNNLMRGRTSLIIAHRLSTILEADKIVVMDAGSIVAQGTHQELIQNCALYQRLYSMQFRAESNPHPAKPIEGV